MLYLYQTKSGTRLTYGLTNPTLRERFVRMQTKEKPPEGGCVIV
jgi:hypothetical protein